MNKVNFKAILLVYILQLAAGAIWYSAAPANLTQHLENSSLAALSTGTIISFMVVVFLYTYFSGWLLAKTNLRSSSERMMLTIGSWLFVVLPNMYFISVFIDLSHVGVGYLLSFGFISCIISACILPFWRASRSIFKG